MSMEDSCQKISLPDVETLHRHILKMITKMYHCNNAKMQARSCWI